MTPLSHNMPCIIWSLLSVVCKCGLQCSRGWEVLWEAHHLWAQVTERGSVLFGLPCLSAPTAHMPVLPVLLRAEVCKRLNPESRLGWPIGGTRTETGRRKRDRKAEERPEGGRETGRRKRDRQAEERPEGGRETGRRKRDRQAEERPEGGRETGRRKRDRQAEERPGRLLSLASPARSDSGSSGTGAVDEAPVRPLSSMPQPPVALPPLFLLFHVRLAHILFNCKSVIKTCRRDWRPLPLQLPHADI